MSTTSRLRRSVMLAALVCALLAASSMPAAAATPSAVPEEQYFSSYGEPEPLIPTQTIPAGDDTPWLPIVLSSVGVVAIAALGATQLARVRIRRRRTAQTAA